MTDRLGSEARRRNAKHLKMLAASYFILAVMFTGCSCFSFPNFVIFMVVAMHPVSAEQAAFFERIPYTLTATVLAIYLVAVLLMARTCFYTCQSYSQRRNYRLLRFSAWLVMPLFPFGTLLGLLALRVLSRPAVQALFSAEDGGGARPAATAPEPGEKTLAENPEAPRANP